MKTVRSFAPGSIGNVGPGLDILGCAVTGRGDEVTAQLTRDATVTITESGHPELSSDPTQHTAGIAAREVLARAGARHQGVTLCVRKGLGLSAGQGGSAASAVAGAFAVNALLDYPLDQAHLLAACLAAEEAVAGRHADNVAPSLLGGFVLVRALDPIDAVQLRWPEELRVVLAIPQQRLRTATARAVLPRSLDLPVALAQAAQVGAIVAALASGDLDLLRRSIVDYVAEPARLPLLPGFADAKAAALDAGALGCSISGAGPTVFAFARNDEAAATIAEAMKAAYRAHDLACETRCERIDPVGARIVETR